MAIVFKLRVLRDLRGKYISILPKFLFFRNQQAVEKRFSGSLRAKRSNLAPQEIKHFKIASLLTRLAMTGKGDFFNSLLCGFNVIVADDGRSEAGERFGDSAGKREQIITVGVLVLKE
jgi:hypothetical protein